VNELNIDATPVARSALRYTPAGVAVTEGSFRHAGLQLEAGTERSLDFEFAAVAVGPVALGLEREPLGEPLRLTGFIAPRSRRSSRLVVHITDYARA
jgi:primosomal replication protein N